MRHSTPDQRKRAISIYRKLNETPGMEAVDASAFPKRRRFGADPRMQSSIQPNRTIPDGGPFKRRPKAVEIENNGLKTAPSGLPGSEAPRKNAPVVEDEITVAPGVETTITMVTPLNSEELAQITGLKPAGIAARFASDRLTATIHQIGGEVKSEWTTGAQYAAALLRLIKVKYAEQKPTGFSGKSNQK